MIQLTGVPEEPLVSINKKEAFKMKVSFYNLNQTASCGVQMPFSV